MLVLSRRRDETIMIGDEVEITIVDIRGDTVRLGINAPRNVSVHRKEIYDAIQAEMVVAASGTAMPSVPDQASVGNLLGSMLKQKENPVVLDPSALASGLRKLTGGAITSSLSAPPLSESGTRKIAKK
jgi:carbon storage regulator